VIETLVVLSVWRNVLWDATCIELWAKRAVLSMARWRDWDASCVERWAKCAVLSMARWRDWDASCIERWAKLCCRTLVVLSVGRNGVLGGVAGLNVDMVVFWMDLGVTATLLVSRLAASVV
jgi:hypothetical protein